MALQFTCNTQFGFELPNAYARIENFNGDKNNITVQVSTYLDKSSRDSNKVPVQSQSYTFALNGNGNFMQLLYANLKALPDFNGAVDV